MSDGASLYDVVPYAGHPYAQTHPDRLATLATLFGLRPPPVGSCRVLELGCGDGGNLAPLASALPGAQFAGIDVAASAVARGRALAEAAGLTNLRLDAVAIEGFDAPPDSFDHVIAHGVYSWVAPAVRDRLLALCRRVLARGGVAYVSYNALPGNHARRALREMLRFHTENVADPRERIARARALLSALLEQWPADQPLRREAERLSTCADASLLHDDLADVNDPVAFRDFAAHAARHGLQYLAEADFFEMQTGVVSGALAEDVLRSDDVVRREQLLDFFKVRAFRQTLLCRDDEAVDRRLRPAVVEPLAISTPAARTDGPRGVTFTGPTGSTLATDHPAVIAALQRATERWPGAVRVDGAC